MKTTDMTLRADEPVKAGILRLADALIDDALRRSRHPSRDLVEDVHFFRTTTKRLRALLQLVRPVISKTAFARENAWLKKAACRLAASRDGAVAGETLKTLAKSTPGHLPAGTLNRAPDEHAKAPTRGDHLQRAMRQAARDLEKARRGLHRLRIDAEGWAAIGPGLLRVYRQARRRMHAAFAHPSDRAFHGWRIRVKHLYYQLEWVEPVRSRRFAAMLKRLHELEEKLGADHDLAVLRKLLKKGSIEFDSPGALRRVKNSAVRRSKRLRRSSKPLGAKVFSEKPACFGRKCRRRWKAWQKQT